jgi:hypothetical protein
MKPKRNRLNARDLLQIGASTYPLTLNIQRARSLEWIRRCPLYLVAPRLGAWLPIDHPITRFFAAAGLPTNVIITRVLWYLGSREFRSAPDNPV